MVGFVLNVFFWRDKDCKLFIKIRYFEVIGGIFNCRVSRK